MAETVPQSRTIPQLRTAGRMAQELGEHVSRVQYVLDKLAGEIRPIGRAGNFRVYDRHATEAVREELAAMGERRQGGNGR